MAAKLILYFGNFRFLKFYTVVLGVIWILTTVQCLEYRRVSRKLLSSPEPDLDTQFSNEELRQLISLLEGTTKSKNNEATTEKASIMQQNAMKIPELMRIHPSGSATTTTTTEKPSVTRITTRRFYRRLRRKTTTTPITPTEPSSTKSSAVKDSSAESSRMLSSGSSPGEILQQLSLLNGILGALNSTAQAPITTNAPSAATNNANDNATLSPEILALFTGAKSSAEASTKSEVVVPPPPSPSPQASSVEDPAAAIALLNLFSNSGSSTNNKQNSENNNAAANFLNLVAQSQQAAMQPSQHTHAPATSETDPTSDALAKLLLQSSAPVASAMPSNSIIQSQSQAQQQLQAQQASANQLNGLLGLLGTLGGAAQQSQSGNINQLFNLGGDQMAQAQTTNSLAQLFGQQQQQQSQTQNLLNLLGGNQGNQGLSLSSLLAPQTGNSIPGLGLLSTVSSLGSSLVSTVSNIFGGGGQGGKPRVRGKGVDTRVGLGYRLGNIGDAQVVWDIGPQLFTDPLRNEVRPYTQKRESGSPSGSHYFQSPSVTATEKEVQQIEAKKRMVQAAIQDHYRKDHFASVYPKPSQRRSSYYNDYSDYYHTYKDPSRPSTSKSSSSSSSSFFTSIPFADHFKGFWSGLTSGISGSGHDDSPSNSHSYNFDDIRSDFSTNLIKRSSNYADFGSRAHQARRMDEDLDDPTHSTLTEYERMLLQYGKDIGIADTKHGVVEDEKDEPQASESGFFSRWFRNPLSSSKPPPAAQAPDVQHAMEWGMGNGNEEHHNYRTLRPNGQAQKSVKKPSPSPSSVTSYGSFTRRNTNLRRNGQRPPKRRSHNPFRNWLASFKHSTQRSSSRPSPHTGGFGRRHFKRPSVSANPKLQHFTNTNKDLMMADANDDFIEGGAASYNNGDSYGHPISYNYADEFPDVDLTMEAPAAPKRYPQQPSRTSDTNNYQTYQRSKTRASLSQREKIIEPALLYDHLEVQDPVAPTEADESFHQRNKVVVNPKLKEIEKQKVLGTQQPSVSTLKPQQSHTAHLAKIQRLRFQNKLRAANTTGPPGKQKILVKIKGKGTPHMKHYPTLPSPVGLKREEMSESTTALPSVLSTISSMFSGTTKPKILNTLIHNATSLFPSITSIRILPSRKNKKEQMKTRLTTQNGKPAIVAIPDAEGDEDDDEQDTAADGDDATPVVQVGHDMTFSDLQSIFAGVKGNGTNGNRRRIRIRVKESVLKGNKKENEDKERKDSDEDEDDEGKDIFVDIESGEVSVLKPVASLVSFNPKQEEASDEEEVDYYEDDDGDGVADADMNRKEHIFAAIQKELVKNFEKMKKAQQRAEAKKRRKQELAEKGVDESIDVITKYFDPVKDDDKTGDKSKLKPVGGLVK